MHLLSSRFRWCTYAHFKLWFDEYRHGFSVSHAASAGESLSVPDPEVHAGGQGAQPIYCGGAGRRRGLSRGTWGADGNFLLQLLARDGVDVSCVMMDTAARSGGAIIQVEPGGRNTMLIYGGANKRIDETQLDAVFARFGRGDMLMLQNETNLALTILCRAAEKGMHTLYNPSPVTPEILVCLMRRSICLSPMRTRPRRSRAVYTRQRKCLVVYIKYAQIPSF